MKKLAIILTISFFMSTAGFAVSVIATSGFNKAIHFGIVPATADDGENAHHEFADTYSTIFVGATSAKVVIKQSNDNITRIDYINANKKGRLEAKIENEHLHIKEEFETRFVFFGNFNTARSELTIQLPQKEYEIITLKLTSGSIAAESLEISTFMLDIALTSGNVNISGITFDEYSVNTTSGSVKLDNASGKGNVELTSGDVTVRYREWNDFLNVEVTSGTVNIELPQDSGIKVDSKVTSGGARYDLGGESGRFTTVKGASFGGENIQDVNIRVTSGSVKFYEK